MLTADMKHTLLTVSLLSAAAALSAQSAGSPKMSYDFIRAGYVQGEEIKGLAISGTALLGEHVLIGGSYQDLTARNLDDVDGEASTFNLGARFGVGSGDIIIGASYGQLQGAGIDGGSVVAVAANVTSLGIAYRHEAVGRAPQAFREQIVIAGNDRLIRTTKTEGEARAVMVVVDGDQAPQGVP